MKIKLAQKQITKISVLSFNNGERYEYTAPAYLSRDAEGFTLCYSEPGMKGAETTLSLKGERLFLSRNDGTRLVFEKDVQTFGVYCMLNGTLTADIQTSALSFKGDKDKNALSLCYLMQMGGQDFSCKMKITF